MIAFVYAAGFALALTPLFSSATALLLGLALSLGLGWKLPPWGKPLGKWVLQGSIVLLGFAMDPRSVLRAGLEGVVVTAVGLVATLALGMWLGRRLGVPSRLATLVATGTAICGGSAIAAVAPVIRAEQEEIAVSLAVVFLLNALALMIFPPLGHLFGLSPESFGWLAAIAIHDTSSVVGAASRYDSAALLPAVTIKLTRALWIAPLALAFALRQRARGGASVSVPLFIPLFLAAVGVRALWPEPVDVYRLAGQVGKAGLNGAIFLVSAQMSRAALAKAGARPLGLAVALWIAVSATALIAIKLRWVG